MTEMKLSSSFRDPAGAVFIKDQTLYRVIHSAYRKVYDHLMGSGLYQGLVDEGLLIPHAEVPPDTISAEDVYKIIQPAAVPVISYPYEWCFSQLNHAALLTLKIMKRAMDDGMMLKDASAYNIQFWQGRPVLIDTLSFEFYSEGSPWPAYRQFCRHFLAPLALAGYCDSRLSQLSRVHLDGIPLDLASRILPKRTYFNFGLFVHIHLHARSEKYFESRSFNKNRRVSKLSLLGMLESLESVTRSLKWKSKAEASAWSDYDSLDSYSSQAAKEKEETVASWIEQMAPRQVWDLGGNAGNYGRIASRRGILTVSLDSDPSACERCYLQTVRDQETNLLPVLGDLTNPSPSIGWENRERSALWDRGNPDLVLVLALMHHLTLTHHISFSQWGAFLSRLSPWVILEFIPPDDPQVQKIIRACPERLEGYSRGFFEKEIEKFFATEAVRELSGSGRVLFLLRRK